MLTLHANTQTTINARLPLQIAHLVMLNLAAPMRLTDHSHDLLWNAQTWTAQAGGILEIRPIIEDGNNIANGFSVAFGNAMLTTFLTQDFEGRTIDVRLALLSGGLVVGDPIIMAIGEMSLDWIDETEGSLTMAIQGESLWLHQYDPLHHARTNEGQKARFPNDDGLMNVARMQKIAVEFGGTGVHYFH